MNNEEKAKELVRQKYAEIALQDKDANQSSCCGAGSCSSEVYNIMTDDYASVGGYNSDADLGLGCGLPTQHAMIKKGDTVIDLGSGAGNDAFIARHETGETGKVIGIDFTQAMIDLAKKNATARAFENVYFRLGDIEHMPVADNTADVVISNCVLNLVPNKKAVFKEIFRVLKPGGHFSISDIVLEGDLPREIKEAAEMYAGCVSGAIQEQVYLELIELSGFTEVKVQKDKPILIPDDILSQYLSLDQIYVYRQPGKGIKSITVYAEKPLGNEKSCCGTDCCN
jgi:arsenite methyltransferase